MSASEHLTTYFKEPGRVNTETTLEKVLKYVEESGIRNVLVATTTGYTGLLASKLFKDVNLVVVTHHTGFKGPGHQELPNEAREKILARGAKVLTTTHALSGVERSVRKRMNTWLPVEIIAQALRCFGQGTKVAIEITVMAADAGLIPMDEDVLAIGGTDRGADTALHIKPAHSNNFFDLRVRRIICKPQDF
ncbi:MAG: pyruvate kinase alpha/beta domain-containing protein [Candidatus Geothermarchaeales archaeon]